MFLETACRVIFRPTAAEFDFKRTSNVLYASIFGVNVSTHFCANMRIYTLLCLCMLVTIPFFLGKAFCIRSDNSGENSTASVCCGQIIHGGSVTTADCTHWHDEFQANTFWQWEIPYKWRFTAGKIICHWFISISPLFSGICSRLFLPEECSWISYLSYSGTAGTGCSVLNNHLDNPFALTRNLQNTSTCCSNYMLLQSALTCLQILSSGACLIVIELSNIWQAETNRNSENMWVTDQSNPIITRVTHFQDW